MNNILKNNISSIILLASVAAGAAFGAIFGEKARVVAPIGQIFMNLLFTLVVPVVFFSVSSSICNMKKNGIMGKTMGRIILVFLGMSIIAAIVGYILMLLISPIEDLDRSYILSVVKIGEIHDPVSAGDTLVHALTSDDFFSLFSKSNLLPLIVFAVLFGVGTAMAGADRIAGLLQQGMDVTIKMMNVVMMLAPVGLGCYFADTIATVGSQIIGGYLRVFIIFAIIAVVFFFVDEFKVMNLCDRHYVIKLYEALMGREPAEDEIEAWVWRLQQ
ncbi:MAG: dicarboxylate/amino acid:cation symporter, partial [Bacteroidales bacterium]|nr:dicarboxylate/amino acid:cation symporter [Bacteroidales bacterium]